MSIMDFFDEEFVFFTGVTNRQQVLKLMSEALTEAGVVKPSFVQGICEREERFPTGLQTEFIGVAIPHTDSVHVNQAKVAVAILSDPVPFVEMGTTDERVNVNVVFMLALMDPEKQLEMLQYIIELLQNQSVLKEILEARKGSDVIDKIRQFSLLDNVDD